MNLFRGQIATDQVFPFPEGNFYSPQRKDEHSSIFCNANAFDNILIDILLIISVLNADQEENLKMLVDPTHKFFQVIRNLL